jgi:hypothetical protein
MTDPTDQLIEAVVACREAGMPRHEAINVLDDVYAAPWSVSDDVAVGRREAECASIVDVMALSERRYRLTACAARSDSHGRS